MQQWISDLISKPFVSRAFRVNCALFIVPKSPFYAGFWLQKSLQEERYAQLCRNTRQTFWVRAHATNSICFTLHTCQQNLGGGVWRVAEGIPMRPSLLLNTKCLLQQLQTQVCDVGKNLLLNIKPPKKPIRSAHQQGGVNSALQWNCGLFLSWSCLKILKAKRLFEGLDQTKESALNRLDWRKKTIRSLA